MTAAPALSSAPKALKDAPMTADPRLIVALDVPRASDARALVDRVGEAVSFYKVGLQLLATDGMAFARELKAEGKQVFLDWKLHDIGATVEKATAALAGAAAGDLLTVHAEPQVMAAAVRGRAGSSLKILAVTVLTSLTDADLEELGYRFGACDLVARRIRQARDCGVDGLVCSPQEASLARALVGDDMLIVTPGVRPSWAAMNDQARAATPAEALKAGASHLVVGRPITAANDPQGAAEAIVREMAEA